MVVFVCSYRWRRYF